MFSSETSPNTGISPQNFLICSFDPFIALLQNIKAIPSTSCKLLNLNQDHPSKNSFQVKSLKIQILLSSLMEMLELPNFCHMTISIV